MYSLRPLRTFAHPLPGRAVSPCVGLSCVVLTVALLGVVLPAGSVEAQTVAPEPRLVIENVLSDGEPLDFSGGVVLPPGRRNLEVRYRVAGDTEAAYRYQFRMEGMEPEWADVGGRTIAYYRNLRPGAFSFIVEAIDPLGSRLRAELPVRVEARFYQTAWFAWLVGLALLAAALLAFRWWTRQVAGQAERLERLVERRTTELKAAKERVEMALADAEHEREVGRQALATVEEQSIQLLHMDHVKSRLFTNLSHEFRTPLTLILDPLDRAVRGELDAPDGEAREAFEGARQNALRLLRLTNQLLDLAKIESGSMGLRASEEDLVSFIRQATEVFSSEAERVGVTLAFQPTVSGLPVFFDREKLEKVIFNLVSNALKATPIGGKVLVSVEVKSNPEGQDRAEIAVRDTGVGIPADQVAHVFDRFYQTDAGRMRGGTGIGLSLVKELVELHHGEVQVESLQDFGSTFCVSLPLGRAHLADQEITTDLPEAEPFSSRDVRPERAPVARAEPNGVGVAVPSGPALDDKDRRPCVLVVEDNPEIRAVIVRHLRAFYRTVEAGDGAEGLRRARERAPDLVVSDVLMPEMDGLELCRRLKQDERLAGTPVILLTARASEESRLEGLHTGADDFLTKPFSRDELLARVENLIRTRGALRQQFSQEVRVEPAGVALPSAEAAFMARLYEALEARLADTQLSVGALAAEMGVSESQLKRRLRAAVDQSPVELIRTYRLDRAAELLRRRVGAVGEVSLAVGFESGSYFARCFRERFGVVPSEYAARMAEDKEAA